MEINKNYTNTNVKYLREKKGISQTRLSKDLNIDPSTLAKWENGSRQITLDWAINIANYFNINVGDFISKNLIIDDSSLQKNTKNYKQILKSKGLMDENENIDEENLNKVLKIVDMIDNINNKKELEKEKF